MGPGTQVIRCAGCGAALQVSARPVEPQKTPDTPAPPAAEGGARPRRRPVVEVSGPRRAEAQPLQTFTVELSQSDIDTGAIGLEAEPAPPAAAPAPAAAPVSVETPWYAEDIERLPEASVSLGQLALENFEPFPPLSLRPDLPQGSRTGTAAARPPGVPTSHLQGK
ncbi:hypothetical protein [Vitiosangium sp. GDMCC 1.1324]|uniref:hypothetical protein n=1 Tax=Vitiosangium sp. (strain GDMCC 1.1324) TaxID=2138576 RepID=UPI000D342959|nr:hypothetical protein [Vitiosangium sp. GDMCC 1.1324]PTL84685.1 hypothetical protein DAT35_06360 [Vitiosangium sp. GDMCC 1.1324]